MSALPSPQAFVDPAIRVVRCLLRCKLFLHTLHPGTEGIAARTALWLRGFEARLTGVGAVIGSTTLSVQTALRVLAFLALPCRRFSHYAILRAQIKADGVAGIAIGSVSAARWLRITNEELLGRHIT